MQGKIVFFSILAYGLFGLPAKAGLYGPPYAITTGSWGRACVLGENSVYCWGENFTGLERQTLKGAKMESMNSGNLCVLNEEGIRCSANEKVPHLKKPTWISTGSDNACAIDIEGVHCWGDKRSEVNRVPSLRNPRSVSVGLYHACAIDDDGLTGWGSAPWSESYVSDERRHAKFVATARGRTCAIYETGLKCWGYGGDWVPPMKDPSLVSLGYDHACALDANGIQCWGWGSKEYGQIAVPALKNPRYVSAGSYYTCALDDEGVHCWGKGYEKEGRAPFSFDIPTVDAPRFHLDQLPQFQNVLTAVSASARSRYISLMSEFRREEISKKVRSNDLNLSRYLMLRFLSPTILSADSSYFREKLIPAFQGSMASIEQELGVHDIFQISGSTFRREIALQSIHSASTVMMEFLTLTDKVPMKEAIRLIDQSLKDPMDNKKMAAVFAKMNQIAPIIKKLSKSTKSAFLPDTVHVALDWLARAQ